MLELDEYQRVSCLLFFIFFKFFVAFRNKPLRYYRIINIIFFEQNLVSARGFFIFLIYFLGAIACNLCISLWNILKFYPFLFGQKTDLVFRILKLFSIFLAASSWLYFLAINLPKNNFSSFQLKFPKSFQELHQLAELLNAYNQTNYYLVLLLFSSAYLYKQTFAIPGSVFLNILAGALYGPIYGTLITSIFSGIGASCCYLFSKHIFGVIINHYFHEKVTTIRNTIEKQKKLGSLFNVLISLRFFPMSPNWLMNMSAPLCGVPLNLFFSSVFIGLIPYNFICAQAGNVVSQIKRVDDLLTWNVIFSFVVMAIVAMVPVIFKNRKNANAMLNQKANMAGN